MADGSSPVDVSSAALAVLVLAPIDHGLAAACREALKRGVTTEKLIEMLLNHLASVVAMVEPAGAREGLIRGLVAAFAPMVKQHVDARLTSPGGIVDPRAGV